MPRPPRLIAELVVLTKSWGWSLHDLAHELGVSYSTLKFYRAGTRDLTMPVYGRIAKRFGEQHREIKDLCWIYATTLGAPELADTADDAARNLRAADAHVLRAYVERFGAESIHGGRGLFLVADDAKPLTSAVAFLRALFSRADVKVVVLAANRVPSAGEQRDALAAPLLIVERVDFLHSYNGDLIRRRADLLRPTVVTSREPLAKTTTDPYLRRIFLSVMRTVPLTTLSAETAPIPSSPSHVAA